MARILPDSCPMSAFSFPGFRAKGFGFRVLIYGFARFHLLLGRGVLDGAKSLLLLPALFPLFHDTGRSRPDRPLPPPQKTSQVKSDTIGGLGLVWFDSVWFDSVWFDILC